jgi:Head domain of trimeric autotransporter adhesin
MKKIFFLITLSFSCTILFAQNVGIGTLLPKARLHVADSSVVFSATGAAFFTSRKPPITGAGRRLMWYSDMAAFRVGYVSGTNWDKDSIGLYSFAVGVDTKAKGNYSIAMGLGSVATATNATAIGYLSTSSGFGSTALGRGTASNSNAVAIGIGTNASGSYSTSIGNFSQATADNSTAIGYFSEATGVNSTAIGNSATASYISSTSLGNSSIASAIYATAIGNSAIASGNSSTAFGKQVTASGTYSTAIGSSTVASGFSSTSFGNITNAIGDYSTAFGSETTANGKYSTALGSNTNANGDYSTALGYKTVASGYAALVTGLYNDSISTRDTIIKNNTALFIVGNGTSDTARSNAFVVRNNGNVGINTSDCFTNLDINGDLALKQYSKFIYDSINNNLNIFNYSFVNIDNPTNIFTITGFTGGVDGKILTILNTSNQNMTIANLKLSSDPANRINTLTGSDIATIGNGSVTLQYSIAHNRWMVIGFRE